MYLASKVKLLNAEKVPCDYYTIIDIILSVNIEQKTLMVWVKISRFNLLTYIRWFKVVIDNFTPKRIIVGATVAKR